MNRNSKMIQMLETIDNNFQAHYYVQKQKAKQNHNELTDGESKQRKCKKERN